MDNDIKVNWNIEKENINNTILDMKSKQLKLKEQLIKELKEIETLRDDIAYADRDDKIYLRSELNAKRDKYDLLNKNVNEKDINLYLSSPYFTKIITENDGFYISKYKKDFDRNIFLFTDPIAKLRFYDVNETEKINGHLHSIKEKVDYVIEESDLKLLTHYKNDYTYSFDGEKLTVLKGEMPKVKKALAPSSDRKIGMQEIIDRMKLEQDTVMRASEVGITLISGGAGTGKTNMAIHRLKYLINEFGNMFKEENMALVCYNVALKEYLTNVISDLNLSNISIFSFDKWAYNLVRSYSNVSFINYANAIKKEFPNVFFFYKPLFQKKANKYELYAIMYILAALGGDSTDDLKIFDHIAVDEVQDFLPIQLSTLDKLSAYSMTLTGDIKQKIFNTNNDNWDALGVNVDNYYELKEVHRSTIQTINFANAFKFC